MRQVVIYLDVDTDDPKAARQKAEDLLMRRFNPTSWAIDRLEVWTEGDDEEDAVCEVEADYADTPHPDVEPKTADDALAALRYVADHLANSEITQVAAVGEAEATNLRSVSGADYGF